jgi:hypothetical protein
MPQYETLFSGTSGLMTVYERKIHLSAAQEMGKLRPEERTPYYEGSSTIMLNGSHQATFAPAPESLAVDAKAGVCGCRMHEKDVALAAWTSRRSLLSLAWRAERELASFELVADRAIVVHHDCPPERVHLIGPENRDHIRALLQRRAPHRAKLQLFHDFRSRRPFLTEAAGYSRKSRVQFCLSFRNKGGRWVKG